MYPNIYQNMPQKYEIIHINGEQGARALQMQPNSATILLDDTAPLVWLCQTDGAGYKTVQPFKIEPYTPAPPVDMAEILKRLEAIEGRLSHESNASNATAGKTSTANE